MKVVLVRASHPCSSKPSVSVQDVRARRPCLCKMSMQVVNVRASCPCPCKLSMSVHVVRVSLQGVRVSVQVVRVSAQVFRVSAQVFRASARCPCVRRKFSLCPCVRVSVLVSTSTDNFQHLPYILPEKSKVIFQSSFVTDGPPEFISPTMGTDNFQGLFRPIQRTESTEVTGLKTTCPAVGCLLHVSGQDVMPTVMNMFQGRRVPMPSQRKMTYTMRQGSWGPGLPPAFVSSPIFTSF